MSRALLAIGVSKAAGLKPLPGAAADAQAMHDWAVAQGYEHIRLLSDAQGAPVTFDDVTDAVEKLMQIGDLERLVIYFSGHGYAPLPQCETLLLSNWETDANEAINLTYSVVYARLYASPQISLIVDACRTTWSTPAPILGQVIFKRVPSGGDPGKVDEFYATQFGDPSQEANGPDAFGVFSRELLEALHGRAPEAFDTRGDKFVVTSTSLERYLEEAVPEASERIPGARVQHPDVNGKWRAPADVYYAELKPAAPVQPQDMTIAHEMARPHFETRSVAGVRRAEAMETRRARVAKAAKSIESLEGRASFETAAGITILGARVKDVFPPVPPSDIFSENGAWHVRLPEGGLGMRLVQIAECGPWEDHWLPLAAFPQRIATARIDAQGFSALNYRPPRRLQPDAPDARGRTLEAALAEATAALLTGALPERARIDEMVDTLRSDKQTNPALAIIAAHICQRIGALGPVREMASFHDIGGGPFTPYDVALIAAEPLLAGRVVVGVCPLMSRGWALPLEGPALQAASRCVAPSLWTLLRPEGAAPLKPLIPNL